MMTFLSGYLRAFSASRFSARSARSRIRFIVSGLAASNAFRKNGFDGIVPVLNCAGVGLVM
jgi:hypothetical protein